jgi:hypothetical protein
MHCPRCGQQQVSEEIKFCSRCGFQLGLIPELIAHGGFLPQLAELQGNAKKTFFNKKNGVVLSVFWFLFFVPFLAFLFGEIFNVDIMAQIFGLIGTVGAFMLALASLIFLPSSKPKYPAIQLQAAAPADLYGRGQNSALPPRQSYPASSYAPPAGAWRAPETGEVRGPGSVTDPTTRFLEKER